MKSDVNPMQSAHAAPRCTAHAKHSGVLCKNPAVRGWAVCRMHGAGGGHEHGPTHPSWKHGIRSQDWIRQRSKVAHMVREWRDMAERDML
jgi:hypothetical protein